MRNMFTVEIDLLNDFINVGGALSIPGAHDLRNNFRRFANVVENAKLFRLMVTDRHLPEDEELSRNGGPWPDHAMADTEGAKIIEEMGYDIDKHLVLSKRTYSMFSNTIAKSLLTYMRECGEDTAIVAGVATEICVKAAVLDMLSIGIKCYVVEDAICGLDQVEVNKAITEMKDAGATFISLDDLKGMCISPLQSR